MFSLSRTTVSRTLSPSQQLADATHRALVGVVLAVLAATAFDVGADVFTTATPATSVLTLAFGFCSLFVCVAAVSWLGYLFWQGVAQS